MKTPPNQAMRGRAGTGGGQFGQNCILDRNIFLDGVLQFG
jgi:hypothetical protein